VAPFTVPNAADYPAETEMKARTAIGRRDDHVVLRRGIKHDAVAEGSAPKRSPDCEIRGLKRQDGVERQLMSAPSA